jgi:hypothetical protein
MIPEDVFPFLIGAIMMMIPIVAILTRHQQKMARIVRGMPEEQSVGHAAVHALHGGHDPAQMEQLRREVADLRQMMAQQSIALDNLAASQAELARAIRDKGELEQRLGQ